MENKLTFRDAERKDIPLVLSFIRQIAEYEKMSDAVIADEKTLEKYIFDQKRAEVFFAMEDNKEIGFALYYFNFSTFVGRSGLYLEDVFIKEEYRHKGYGKAILKKLAEKARDLNCGRMEWVCLNWNRPSIAFYTSLGAIPMSDWTTYRLDEEGIRNLAEKEF